MVENDNKRIYIDARSITIKPNGMRQVTMHLVPELIRLAPEYEWIIIRHTSNCESFLKPNDKVQEVFTPIRIYKWYNFFFGFFALYSVFKKFGKPALFYNTFHITPLGLRLFLNRKKIIIILHDFIWIDYANLIKKSRLKSLLKKYFAKLAIPYTLKHADHVICISEPVRRRAMDYIDSGKTTTILHGVDSDFFKQWDSSQKLLRQIVKQKKQYIIAISNDKVYKNLYVLIKAFKIIRQDMDVCLVLIGRCENLRDQANQTGFADDILFTGFLSKEELLSLLGHASVFVFPSLVEGFGLPPLEAMAMGVPCIVSNIEPMISVVGEAAIKFDPFSPEELAQKIRLVLTDKEVRKQYKISGIKRASELTWETTAIKSLEVFKKVLKEQPGII